jgi:hypothetical protein
MTGYNWLKRLSGGDPLDIPRITVATDSLDKKSGNVVAVSVDKGDDTTTIYLADSHPHLNLQFTGIDMDEWNMMKMSKDEANVKLGRLLGDTGVVYFEKFTRYWLSTVYPKAGSMSLIDVCDLVAFQEAGYSLVDASSDLKTIGDLVEAVHVRTIPLPTVRFARYAEILAMPLLPTYIKRLRQLTEIYKQCLHREM